jgi:hypothetical protein
MEKTNPVAVRLRQGVPPIACWDSGFDSRRSMDVCLVWMSVPPDRCLYSGPITRAEESYRILVCYCM